MVLEPTSISKDLVSRFRKDSEDRDGEHSRTNGIDDDDDDNRWWRVLVAALCASIVLSNRLVLVNNDASMVCETDDERMNRLLTKVVKANRDKNGIYHHQWVVVVVNDIISLFNTMIDNGPVIVAVPVDLIATVNDDQLMYYIARQIAQHLLEYDLFFRSGYVPYHKPADPELLLKAAWDGLLMAARAGMDPEEVYRFWMKQDEWNPDRPKRSQKPGPHQTDEGPDARGSPGTEDGRVQ